MKKSEMQAHRTKYRGLIRKVRAAQANGLYRKAVELSLSSLDYVDGMMQYERRYLKAEFDRIEAIDVVLDNAPPLLDFDALRNLESLLKDKRRIEKNTTEDLGTRLSAARDLMWNAHRLWNLLEQSGATLEQEFQRLLGGKAKKWRAICEAWERMTLVRRTREARSYRVTLLTRLGAVVKWKCPSCGSIAEAPKAMFLEETSCPYCEERVFFVLLSSERTSALEE